MVVFYHMGKGCVYREGCSFFSMLTRPPRSFLTPPPPKTKKAGEKVTSPRVGRYFSISCQPGTVISSLIRGWWTSPAPPLSPSPLP